MASAPLDAINVAPLLMDESTDRFDHMLRESGTFRTVTTIAPTPFGICDEATRAIDRAAVMISDAIAEIHKQHGLPHIVLIGRSYGGFVALLAGLRMQLRDILLMIAIEAPLHPDVLVEPPRRIPKLRLLCAPHYKARPEIAREAMEALRKLGTDRLVLVQGGQEDAVVPTESQVLEGDFAIVDYDDSHDLFGHGSTSSTGGTIVHLPSDLGGDTSNPAALVFPAAYRTHLLPFWSSDKTAAVQSVIAQACRYAVANGSLART